MCVSCYDIHLNQDWCRCHIFTSILVILHSQRLLENRSHCRSDVQSVPVPNMPRLQRSEVITNRVQNKQKNNNSCNHSLVRQGNWVDRVVTVLFVRKWPFISMTYLNNARFCLMISMMMSFHTRRTLAQSKCATSRSNDEIRLVVVLIVAVCWLKHLARVRRGFLPVFAAGAGSSWWQVSQNMVCTQFLIFERRIVHLTVFSFPSSFMWQQPFLR